MWVCLQTNFRVLAKRVYILILIQPVKDISEAVKKLKHRYKPLIHTDAAQTLGKVEVNACDLGVDYLTIVGHKVFLGCSLFLELLG